MLPQSFWFLLFFTHIFHCGHATPAAGDYHTVVTGYDWGAAVNKVVLMDASATAAEEYRVSVVRQDQSGERQVLSVYPSDAEGNRRADGDHRTLVLSVGPTDPFASPILYQNGSNNWVNYQLTITHSPSGRVWDQEAGKIMPQVDRFQLDGTFTHEATTLTFADYVPDTGSGKNPLIIWLHGGGEGGTDTTIPLLANLATNYASPEIQSIFDGAYVLVPQTPGAWMHNASGRSTRGEENDVYNQTLLALIDDYLDRHPGIDRDRIYLGGCSNGGYMTIKLLLLRPDFFAAAFPSALAYNSEFLTDDDIRSISDTPIWFIHSKDDPVTTVAKTALPVYERLMAAKAPNVHFSLYDHVVDVTGLFGGEGFHYRGHFSWIYSHKNHCRLDYDGSPVRVDGQPVTIMEWLAAQSR